LLLLELEEQKVEKKTKDGTKLPSQFGLPARQQSQTLSAIAGDACSCQYRSAPGAAPAARTPGNEDGNWTLKEKEALKVGPEATYSETRP